MEGDEQRGRGTQGSGGSQVTARAAASCLVHVLILTVFPELNSGSSSCDHPNFSQAEAPQQGP